jgi:hypothetical protein
MLNIIDSKKNPPDPKRPIKIADDIKFEIK